MHEATIDSHWCRGTSGRNCPQSVYETECRTHSIGVPIFFLVKATGNVSLAALSMMIVMLPLFFLAMYEKDGQPLEVVVEHFIQTKFVRPKVRPYQTDNYYDALMRQYKLEKEVERIVFQKEATGKKHQNACKSESETAARN